MIRPQIKPARIKDEDYLAFIRLEPCVGLYLLGKFIEEHAKVCGFRHRSLNCEPNHIRKGVQTGMRTKPTDRRVLPFCETLHDEYTALEFRLFCTKYDLTLEILETEMARLNRLFDQQKTPKELRVLTSRLKHATFECACSESHRVKPISLHWEAGLLHFWCPKFKNWLYVKLRAA